MAVKSFVELKPKTCTFVTENDHEIKKVKGIYKNVVDYKLKYNVLFYRSCVVMK